MIRILHIDDEPLILDISRIYLERTGDMEITPSGSVEEALNLMKLQEFDVIVSDYEMPGMNGIEFLFELRSTGNTIPFIIFTGRGREDVVIDAMNKGADFYIQKGGDARSQFTELRNAIRKAVEKSRFQGEIRESEQRIMDIFRHLPDPTFAIDCSGRVIAWNKAMESMTGIPAGEIVGKGDYLYATPFYGAPRPMIADLLLHPEAEMTPPYVFHHRDRSTIIAETAEARLNGKTVALWAKATLLYDKTGSVTGAIESVRDITEQKRAEKELKAADLYRRSLIEAHIDPLVTVGPDRCIMDVNEATETLFGRKREGLIGADFCSLFTDPMAAEEAYRRVVAVGNVKELALTIEAEGGTIQDVLFYGSPYHDSEGNTLGVFAELHEPLPGQKEASDFSSGIGSWTAAVGSIVSAAASVGSTRAFLEAAVEAILNLPGIDEACIVLCDQEGDRTVIQKAGKNALANDPVPAESEIRQRLFIEKKAVFCPGEGEGWHLLFPLVAEGRTVCVLRFTASSAETFREEAQSALAVVSGIITVIYTGMLRAGKDAETHRKEVLHLDVLAHDLGNTTAAALGYAEILQSMLEGEEARIVARMTAAMEKGQDIIRSIETSSRGDAPRLQNLDLDRMIMHEITRFPGARIDYSGCSCTVLADELAGEVFWNLIDNCVKHGGSGVSILIGVREDGERVEVTIADTGPGIPEALRSREASDGEGLGLSIVRRLVSRYGGEVRIGYRVPGQPEAGTAVSVTFLKADVQSGAAQRQSISSLQRQEVRDDVSVTINS